MLDVAWIELQIGEIDERLATLTEGRRLLEQLRERYQALLDLHISPRAGAVRNGERTSAAQAGERGFDSRPPLQSQPGSARDGRRERSRHGRRAPAAEAVAPSAPSSDPVGTPTPASHACTCERTFTSAHALRIHRARSHGEPSERPDNTASRAARRQARDDQAARAAAAEAALLRQEQSAAPRPLGADIDRRNIDELCPRGCGQRFRWEPSLLSHIRSCKGPAQAEPGGGLSVIAPPAAGVGA